MHVDLLAFGPHPDDLEIGMAGTLAKHAALGARVGLCDLTRGEMGSNGTPEERVAEAEAAGRVLGAAWRVNLGLPDGGLAPGPTRSRAIVELIRRARPSVIAIPHAADRHPDHGAAHHLLVRAVFDAGLRRFAAAGDPVAAVCRVQLLHQRLRRAVVRRRRVGVLRAQARGARLLPHAVPDRRARRGRRRA